MLFTSHSILRGIFAFLGFFQQPANATVGIHAPQYRVQGFGNIISWQCGLPEPDGFVHNGIWGSVFDHYCIMPRSHRTYGHAHFMHRQARFVSVSQHAPPPRLQEHSLHIWKFILDTDIPNAQTLLNSAEKARYHAQVQASSARQFLNSRYYLRQILSRYLHIPAHRVEIEISSQGKPRLAGLPLHFNLSHSQGLGVLAVSRDQPVGIDLEKPRPMKNMQSIAQRLLPDASRCVPGENRLDWFFAHWTAMEASQKARGQGMFRQKVAVSQMHCQHFIPETGYLAAVATENTYTAPNLQFFVLT